jgi:hypothetical protein
VRYKGEKGKAWEAVKRRTRAKEKHCYTCGAKNLEGQNAQAGHYRPVAIVGSNNRLSWDERFIHLQCGWCNGIGQGMVVEYRAHLVKDYGEEIVTKFDATYRRINPVTSWQELIDGPILAL